MKLIYFTSKIFPASTADHFFVLQMARAFTSLLHKDFLLIVGAEHNDELRDIPHYSFNLKMRRGKRIFIFFKFLFVVFARKLFTDDTVFFTNDRSLLRILFFWKRILPFKYRVVSDWHMLSDDEEESDILKNSDGLVTTTKHLKDLIISRFRVPEGKILTAYGGVDIDIFLKITETTEVLRKRLNLPISDFLVGYVGYYKTMGMSKGLDTMIEALALIPDKTVKMVFVGGGKEDIEEYSNLAKEKGVFDRAIFIPVVSSETLALYEKAVDILVIPYPDKPHFREYGFPMKTYEYLAAKKPVIYSDLIIIREVLSDCAISFNPGDPKNLSEKILEIKNNSTKTKDMIFRSYKKAEDFSWKSRAEKIIAFSKKYKSNFLERKS
ncbi:MAG: glycosyltransferase family 4 protein [Candidatus Parcubacteria bacterium]|nr:glycosyltransferase family 4 protein [Candidatus Parcubacteria bacterium]